MSAAAVEQLLTETVATTLREQHQGGMLNPEGALTYLKGIGIPTGDITRYDVADWLRTQPKETPS